MDLLAYALGAEIRTWKREALMCEYTIVEVSINGVQVTLRRSISDSKLNPMDIFWGTLEDADKAPTSAWEQYSYRSSEQRLSFSQSLFRALDLPEVHGERGSNITMHQILRLAYADQLTPPTQIFRSEQFDNALTRETVGNLMCGVYDDRLYGLRLDLERLDREHAQLTGQLSSIYNLLGRAEQTDTVDFIGQEIIARKNEINELTKQLSDLRERKVNPSVSAASTAEGNLRMELRQAREQYLGALEQRDRLTADLEDSRRFIAALRFRLAAATDSDQMRSWLGNVAFQFCPACFSPVGNHASPNNCPLCKSPLTAQEPNAAALRMRNELELQHRESETLYTQRLEELKRLERDLPRAKEKYEALSKRLEEVARSPNSQLELEIESLSQKVGYTQKQIESLHERQKLFGLIKELSDRKAELNANMSRLREEIEGRRTAQERRRQEAYLAIADCTKDLLRRDFIRQPDFLKAENVQIDFAANQVAVDNETQFSASSMVFLNRVFHLAMLWASTTHDFFRFPRFLMLDGIEEGGMERDRSHNLQRIISELSLRMSAEHQIIFATAEIAPELETSDLVIGHHFTHEHRSLALS
jgi:predicted  nucleic acid-binding Zn-ribbon protein